MSNALPHDATPEGPQLNDVDLKAMDNDAIRGLAAIVLLDLKAAESLHDDGDITREELRWVQSDAERVRDECIRRNLIGWGEDLA